MRGTHFRIFDYEQGIRRVGRQSCRLVLIMRTIMRGTMRGIMRSNPLRSFGMIMELCATLYDFRHENPFTL